MKKLLILLLFPLFLSACGTQIMKELAKEIKGMRESPAPKPSPQPAVYCYSTLGIVTCYDKPREKDEDAQFIGSTVQPIDPKSQENLLKGETDIPPPAIPAIEDMTKQDDAQNIPADTPIAEPKPAAEIAPDAPPLEVKIEAEKAESMAAEPEAAPEAANKPFSQDFEIKLETEIKAEPEIPLDTQQTAPLQPIIPSEKSP